MAGDGAGVLVASRTEPYYLYLEASLVLFDFELAAITPVLLAWTLLGRMNSRAWTAFTPLCLPLPVGGASSTTPADTWSLLLPSGLRSRQLHRRHLGKYVSIYR